MIHFEAARPFDFSVCDTCEQKTNCSVFAFAKAAFGDIVGHPDYLNDPTYWQMQEVVDVAIANALMAQFTPNPQSYLEPFADKLGRLFQSEGRPVDGLDATGLSSLGAGVISVITPPNHCDAIELRTFGQR